MKKIKLKGQLTFTGFDRPVRQPPTQAAPSGNGKRTISEQQLAQAIANLKDGATLRSQSNACGYKGDDELRNALRAKLGQEGYKALFAGHKRGPAVVPTERVRANDKNLPMLDGAKLKWRKSDAIMAFAAQRMRQIREEVKNVKASSALGQALAREYKEMKAIVQQPTAGRWSMKRVAAHEPKIVKVKTNEGLLEVKDSGSVTLYVSPKGHEYVVASPLEIAHLRIKYPDGRIIRLARWTESSQGKKTSKALTQHEKALTHHAKAKRAKSAK